jgi:hypothetical protein
MAAMLLAGGASLALSGCLLFEDYPVLPTLPPELNGPMQFVTSQIVPPQHIATLRVPGQCREELFVTVDDENQMPPDGGVDPNPAEMIHSLWFVPGAQPVAGNPVPHWGVRTISALPAVYTAMLGLVGDGQQHMVEVRVTDGEYQQRTDGTYEAQPYPLFLPDGTQVTDRVYDLSYVWFLTLEGCP